MRMTETPPRPVLDAEMLAIQPLERAETIPSHWYVDPAIHAFDRTALFSRTWHYLGPAAWLAEPGAYVAAEVVGEPVVAVRTREGALRAFFNVCRHRGGPLVMDARGCANVLQCKYHGWTYRLDGTLRGVPRFDRTELFDKRDYGLVPVALAVWQGLVFVHLGADPTPLDATLDGITERIAPTRLDALHFYRRDVYEVACNWKVYMDNYLEGYHIPLVHPDLLGVLDYRAYCTETHPHYSLQVSPLDGTGDDAFYGADGGGAYYYCIFPSTMLNVLPGRLQVNSVVPLAPDRCRVVFDYFYVEAATPAALRKIEEDVLFSDRVQHEDAEICEHIQRGLRSRAYDRGRFSVEMEEGVYHFQCLLKRAYRAALESSA